MSTWGACGILAGVCAIASVGLVATEDPDRWWQRLVHCVCSLVAFPAVVATLLLFCTAAHVFDSGTESSPAQQQRQPQPSQPFEGPDCNDHGLPSLC